MRSKILALLTIDMLITVAVLTANPSRPVSAQSATASAASTCSDSAFLTALGQDFTDINTATKGIDYTKAADVSTLALKVALFRQKYEDMTVPTECFPTQLIVIVYAANLGDVLTLSLAQLADPADAATFKTALDSQTARLTN